MAKSESEPKENYKPKNQYITDGTIFNPGFALETPQSSSAYNINCSCVLALNDHYGTNFRTLDGFARSIPVNSHLPAETGFVVTYEGDHGHIAHYYRLGAKLIIDWEANFKTCEVTSGRELPINSAAIKGYLP